MAKTINPQINIFGKQIQAEKEFIKTNKPCQMLESQIGKVKMYFIDYSKEAIIDWPTKYTLLKEK